MQLPLIYGERYKIAQRSDDMSNDALIGSNHHPTPYTPLVLNNISDSAKVAFV